MKKLFSTLAGKLQQPKWRHGGLGSALMALVILVAVLVNVVAQRLEDDYGLRTDMSFNHYASTGMETEKVLAQLENEVDVYLLYQNGEENSQLMQVLSRYTVLSDKVRLLPTDVARNPGILTRFSGELDSALDADSVIVHCPATDRYRVLNYGDFYAEGYDIESGSFVVEGINYEKAVTGAILYATQQAVPTVGILQGHGELTPEEMETLLTFLEDNQYETRTVNLLGGDTLEGVSVLLIADPLNDLDDTEIDVISRFAQEGGNLFVVRDYTDPLSTMPNYLSLLRSYGVVPLEGVVVAGEEDAGSYYGETLYLLPYMTDIDLTLPLTSTGMDVLMLPVACAFEEPPQPGTGDLSLSVATVLKTGPNAYLRNTFDGVTTIDKQPGDRSGELALALYAHRMHANGNVSRMFAIGNSTMLVDPYIYQRTFNEQFIITVMGQLAPQGGTSLDIMATAAFRPALTAGDQHLGVGLIIALPLLCIAAALIILLPRRNR